MIVCIPSPVVKVYEGRSMTDMKLVDILYSGDIIRLLTDSGEYHIGKIDEIDITGGITLDVSREYESRKITVRGGEIKRYERIKIAPQNNWK